MRPRADAVGDTMCHAPRCRDEARGRIGRAHSRCRDRRPGCARSRDVFGESRRPDRGSSHQSQLPRRQCHERAARTNSPTDRPATENEYPKRHRPRHGQCDPDRDRSLRVHRRRRAGSNYEFPWTRTSSRRRREIIQGVDELKRPQRAMRTKARDGFVKASGAAHRWLDELLSDANPEHRVACRPRGQERALDPDDAIPRFSLPRPGGSRNGRTPAARVQRQAPDRTADALVRPMGRLGTSGTDSDAGRNRRLIDSATDPPHEIPPPLSVLPTRRLGCRRWGSV